MSYSIAVLPGDGIGPEIVEQAQRILTFFSIPLEIRTAAVGGSAFDVWEHPLPQSTLQIAKDSNAILFGSVGDWKYDHLPKELRPEQAILGLRKTLGLFANIRPAKLYPQLIKSSTVKPEIISKLDLLIIRELTGDVYFGEPRGTRMTTDNECQSYNTMQYSTSEIVRIAKIAFEAAKKRKGRLCSVDKANVLETSQLWRSVMNDTAKHYSDVQLSHMYIDNAAMQLIKNPCQFDVIVTSNLFGDILSDEAAMLTGSIGMLPSASINSKAQGLYEPSHGSAPDISGKDIANPLATILSVAMLFRFSLKMNTYANQIEQAVFKTLDKGFRTLDIYEEGTVKVGTSGMGDAVLKSLHELFKKSRT